MTPHAIFASVAATLTVFQVLSPAQAPAPQAAQTPAACLADVRAYVAKRQQELRPLTTEASATLTAERTAMVKACVARFENAALAPADLGGMADLYAELNQWDKANAAVAKALASRGLTDVDRAGLLGQSIRLMLREPKGDERNARIEKVVDQLDAIGAPAVLETKIAAHVSMNGYYRGDDIDAGIIKHSTWLIDTGKALSPDLRKKYGNSIVSAYVNMAEAYAGQARNDEAIALLKRAPAEWPDLPGVEARVQPTLERYELVGTLGAPITAPRWLNLPDFPGTQTYDPKGRVTLLEFTAHWCGPCRESYPGVNRLREKYGARGFQVVVATQFYGYFGSERNLSPEAEFEKDRAYFAEHGLDVPIAVGDKVTASVKDGVVVYSPAPNPNDAAYKVGGIPQIQIIDRQGRIRLIMVGYDDANEPALAKFIEKLLAEK
jgi:thiol-disulfide isomerase/thioredoxin